MQIVLTCGLAAVVVFQTWPGSEAQPRSPSAVVRRIVDSHTIDVAGIGRVALLGITTPPRFEGEAQARLVALVLQRWVHLEHEGQASSRGRSRTAYVVREDGLSVNAALVRDGLARISGRHSSPRGAELERAEREARAARRGLWALVPPDPPTGYTRRSPSIPDLDPWPSYLSNTHQNVRFASATSFITGSTTGRSGSSSSSSRQAR